MGVNISRRNLHINNCAHIIVKKVPRKSYHPLHITAWKVILILPPLHQASSHINDSGILINRAACFGTGAEAKKKLNQNWIKMIFNGNHSCDTTVFTVILATYNYQESDIYCTQLTTVIIKGERVFKQLFFYTRIVNSRDEYRSWGCLVWVCLSIWLYISASVLEKPLNCCWYIDTLSDVTHVDNRDKFDRECDEEAVLYL